MKGFWVCVFCLVFLVGLYVTLQREECTPLPSSCFTPFTSFRIPRGYHLYPLPSSPCLLLHISASSFILRPPCFNIFSIIVFLFKALPFCRLKVSKKSANLMCRLPLKFKEKEVTRHLRCHS